MSYLAVAPELLASAATDLTGIGSALIAAHAEAAAPITAVVTAADDEVSAAVVSLFSGTGSPFRRLARTRRRFMPSLCGR